MDRTDHDPGTPDSGSSPRRTARAAAALAAMAAVAVTGAAGAHAAPDQGPEKHAHDHDDAPTRTVAPGDTVWSIASVNGVAVEDLMAWNDLPADGALRVGQTLRLTAPAPEREDPAPAPPGTPAPAPAEPSRPPAAEHRVQPGDSLWSLAQQHHVTVESILRANDLDVAAPLKVGRTLEIPGSEQAPAPSEPAPKAPPEPERAPSSSDAVRNDFPGHDYPDETVAAANASHDALQQRPAPSREEAQRLVAATARDMGVDPALALAHSEQESDFVHQRVSPANAVGMMQVMPSAGQWAQDLTGRPLDLLDPQDNVTAGVAIIRANTQGADDHDQAIAAYYQGLHGVKEYGFYPDTKTYVAEVKAKEAAWRKALPAS